ncbi:copper resistance CopC family protein [Corynebacterium propinquum]|uniref:copper resistance CopC family protein n=1 Tax=Corynebacterium propinquum TaxID=43769 RepID=UPI0020BE1C3F|nr:copper resistance protein CopC [Corynebacterium propinquum]UQV59400.1 copper resistance protein CopC [Corynebacterium propinquum]
MSSSAQRTPIRRIGAGLATATLSAAALWSFAPQASAHDVVVDSNPADGSVVEEFPDSIVLEFSGEPREGFNTVAVSNASGETIFDAEPDLDGRVLTVDVPDNLVTPDGTYSVGYQITSSDGHATRGGLEFSVGNGGGTASSASADSQPDNNDSAEADTSDAVENAEDSQGAGAASIVIAIGAIAAAIGVIVLLVQKRKRFDN